MSHALKLQNHIDNKLQNLWNMEYPVYKPHLDNVEP